MLRKLGRTSSALGRDAPASLDPPNLLTRACISPPRHGHPPAPSVPRRSRRPGTGHRGLRCRGAAIGGMSAGKTGVRGRQSAARAASRVFALAASDHSASRPRSNALMAAGDGPSAASPGADSSVVSHASTMSRWSSILVPSQPWPSPATYRATARGISAASAALLRRTAVSLSPATSSVGHAVRTSVRDALVPRASASDCRNASRDATLSSA